MKHTAPCAVCLPPHPRKIHPATWQTPRRPRLRAGQTIGHTLPDRALQLQAHELVHLRRKLQRQLVEHLTAEAADDHAWGHGEEEGGKRRW